MTGARSRRPSVRCWTWGKGAPLLDDLRFRIRTIFRRRSAEADLDDEVRFHLDRTIEKHLSHGLSPTEARRQARLAFGQIDVIKDDCRGAWGVRQLDALGQNLRFALRTFRKSPGFTAVAVVSLALGIGANAAIFSLFNQILLRPLPVVEPERLVNLEAPGPKLPGFSTAYQAVGRFEAIFSYPMFRDLERDNTVFTDIAAHRPFDGNVVYDGQTFSGRGVVVSGSYFPMLGVVPALGRLLGPEVDAPVGGHPVVVLSHDFWQSRLGGRPDILGDPIRVNGQPFTIVGVAPPGFRGTTLGVRPMLFAPITMRFAIEASMQYETFEHERGLYWVYLFARLKPGVSIAQAGAALEPLYRSLLRDVVAGRLILGRGEATLPVDRMSEERMAQFLSKPIPITDGRRGQSALDEETRVPLLLLFGVTLFVVLIACANIANLLLARAAVRASEMAVRLSVGAARRHLLAQLLTESCLLALIGGAAGLIVARATLGGIGVLLPPEAVNAVQLTLDPSVVLFTVAISVLTGLLFGIVPALHCTRADLISTLKDHAGQPAGARAAARFRSGLVIAQFALSTTLLIAAGLFIQSLSNVTRLDLGILPEDVTTFRLAPALSGYADEQRRQALYERVEAELAALPGVTDVSVAYVPVFAGPGLGNSVMVEGFEADRDTDRSVRWNGVGPGYYRTLGIPVLAGREFTESDVRLARNWQRDRRELPQVVIVNEAFARKFNLGRDPVGKRMARMGRGSGSIPPLNMEIIGLVKDATYIDVKDPVPPQFAIPSRKRGLSGFPNAILGHFGVFRG